MGKCDDKEGLKHYEKLNREPNREPNLREINKIKRMNSIVLKPQRKTLKTY